jgi:hypothetical protein
MSSSSSGREERRLNVSPFFKALARLQNYHLSVGVWRKGGRERKEGMKRQTK